MLIFQHGEIRSVIIKVQHNCTSDRRQYGKLEDPPIKHEYCVVFRKTEAKTRVGIKSESAGLAGTIGAQGNIGTNEPAVRPSVAVLLRDCP